MESHVPVIDPRAASKEIDQVFSDFKRQMGIPFVPNVMGVLGHSHDIAQGTWEVIRHVLVQGTLPRALKETIIMAVSNSRNCVYCQAAHASICRMLGISDETLAMLTPERLSEIRPLKSRDILQFSVKCAREPQSLTSEDFKILAQHGLSQAEILEVIAMSALSVYINTLVDATGIPVDSFFRSTQEA